MTHITMSPGESLADLLRRSGNLISFSSGIWLVEKGSLQKRSLRTGKDANPNIMDDYSIVNIYSCGDYLMGDSDLVIDYFALEETIISQVALDKIDPVKVLFQLNYLEEYVHYATYNAREDSTNGRITNLIGWLCKKLNCSIAVLMKLISQEELGRMIGLHRTTINRKLRTLQHDLSSREYKHD